MAFCICLFWFVFNPRAWLLLLLFLVFFSLLIMSCSVLASPFLLVCFPWFRLLLTACTVWQGFVHSIWVCFLVSNLNPTFRYCKFRLFHFCKSLKLKACWIFNVPFSTGSYTHSATSKYFFFGESVLKFLADCSCINCYLCAGKIIICSMSIPFHPISLCFWHFFFWLKFLYLIFFTLTLISLGVSSHLECTFSSCCV